MSQARFPGHELRARREEMGLSPEDVYRKIRVPLNFIEHIESGDLEGLPAPCYSIGFLKTYCQLLELNPYRFADTFQECVRPGAGGFFGLSSGPRRRPKWVANVLSWAAVCGVFALLWFTYASLTRPYLDSAARKPASAATVDELRPPAEWPGSTSAPSLR